MRQLNNKKWPSFLCLLATLASLAVIAFDADRLRRHMQERYGDDGGTILNAWLSMLSAAKNQNAKQQLDTVNSFFNRRIQFGEDRLLWQEKDYWASPLETMGLRGGDCEDFSIAKYFSLLEIGMPAEQLRLIYVKATLAQPGSPPRSVAHMVVGYYESSTAMPLILDNLQTQVSPASERGDLQPVFSFNSAGLWVGTATASVSDPTARLSQWRAVLERMQEEGF